MAKNQSQKDRKARAKTISMLVKAGISPDDAEKLASYKIEGKAYPSFLDLKDANSEDIEALGFTREGAENIKSKIGESTRVDDIKRSFEPRIREWKFTLYLFRKSALAVVGILIILSIIMMAIAAPWLAPTPDRKADKPLEIPLDDRFRPIPPLGWGTYDGEPKEYLLGAGYLGADIFYGVVWGARVSIQMALTVIVIASIIGVLLGVIAGYYGGWIDEIIMRVSDVFLSIPGLILAMAVVTVLDRSIENIMLALAIIWWPPYTRLVRGQVLTVREETYIEAARAIGSKKSRIMFKHVVPNSFAPMLVAMTMDLGAVVLVAAGLSYIGFGPPTGYAEWGRMVSDGQEYFMSRITYEGQFYTPWWMVTFPGMAIFMFVLGFNLLGDGVRDIMDPRLRR